MAAPFALDDAAVTAILVALETEGVILRGWFSPGSIEEEWCDRRLLARIHRDTLQRLRAEIQPVSAADFMRFLFAWQHVAPGSRVAGLDGVRAVVARLDGFELAADAWERHVLPARVDGYDPSMLDLLCFSGETAWGRVSTPPRPNPADPLPPRPIRATPIAVFLRDHAAAWRTLAATGRE